MSRGEKELYYSQMRKDLTGIGYSWTKLTKEYGQVVLLSHQNLQLGGGHILDLEVQKLLSQSPPSRHPPNLSGDVMSVRAGEEVEDALGVQQVALVVDRLPHLEQGQGRVVADPVCLGGLLVVDPDQGDPVTSHLLSNSLQNAQHSVTGLAVL